MSSARPARRWVTEVVVVGDGPAGSALAAATAALGIETLLVGDDAPWSATYGSFVDDIDDAELVRGRDVFAHRMATITVHARARHVLERPYGVVDNAALRVVLRDDLDHLEQRVVHVEAEGSKMTVTSTSGSVVEARIVVDATGWPPVFASSGGGDRGAGGLLARTAPRWSPHQTSPAWQTAYGVVLPAPPTGDLGEPVLMDFRPVPGGPTAPSPTTFAYAIPQADGWLVEETVLAARPAVEPGRLEARLAARLGRTVAELREEALAVEEVRIPMGAPLPTFDGPVVPFGAAAGYVHPATGYSLATSLRAAPRVATAIASVLGHVRPGAAPPVGRRGLRPASAGGGSPHRPGRDERRDRRDGRIGDTGGPGGSWGGSAGTRGVGDDAAEHAVTRLAEAVWPTPLRRSRALHEFGLDVLLGLDAEGVRSFFSTFFELDQRHWSAYLRADASPREVSAAMSRVFRSAPWALRRRLMAGDPRRLAPLIRP